MRKIFILLLGLCFSITQANGQYVLDTPDGKKVKLNSNGTWQFLNQTQGSGAASGLPGKSTAQYQARFKKYAVWYDPAEWICDTSQTGDVLSWDATFYSIDKAIVGYCLASRLATPVHNLESALRQQWQQTGVITSFSSFQDTVNNLPVTGDFVA